ncbi:MAG TPA: hypothetical protein VMW16_02710 [Sedimentisphaerales bacterium]|nr:hypothetical protein [Sedimentisphaerales bacterium]
MTSSRIIESVVAVTIAGFLAAPAQAHPKYWPNASGLLVPYSHRHYEPAEPGRPQAAEGFDLLSSASDIAGRTSEAIVDAAAGVLKALGNAAKAIFGREHKEFGETIEGQPGTIAPKRPEYRYLPNASGFIIRVPAG